MRRSSWELLEVKNGIAYIQDLDGPVSVTNDAENVFREVSKLYNLGRIVYRDTYGEWTEICTSVGDYLGDWRIAFKPWHGQVWDILTKE